LNTVALSKAARGLVLASGAWGRVSLCFTALEGGPRPLAAPALPLYACKRLGCYQLVRFESAGDAGPKSGSTREDRSHSNTVF
jgi:hypothetical protein